MLRILVYGLGTAAGALASRLGIPLPWMIGSMIVSAVLTISLDLTPPPRFTRFAGQTVVGAAIGLHVTAEALTSLAHLALPMVLSAIIFVIWGCLIGILLQRATGVDRATAVFSCVPGGTAEMANLAIQYGGNPALPAMAQALRVMGIVLFFPPLVYALSGAHADAPMTTAGEVHLAGTLLLLVVAAAAGTAASLLGVMNAYFLGPMLLIGVMTAASLPMPGMPAMLVAAAQVLLGVSLGGMIQRKVFSSTRGLIPWTIATSLLLLIVTIAVAALWTMLLGGRFWTLVLANAPGGATEMALTAQTLHFDISLVMGFQLSRIVIILVLLPLIYRWVNRW